MNLVRVKLNALKLKLNSVDIELSSVKTILHSVNTTCIQSDVKQKTERKNRHVLFIRGFAL